jgi:carbon starvation protein CstA
MAVGILSAMFFQGYKIPEITLTNLHNSPEKFPFFPMMFVTIACGAISGFHSTQSPLMARCIENEKLGRRVFYGAMITEAIVAMIWAAIAMAFFGGVEQLNNEMVKHQGNAAYVVNLISNTLLGRIGAILALLGVVAAPITSGDTALRSGRLIIADYLKMNQQKIVNRLIITVYNCSIVYHNIHFNTNEI